MFQLQITIQKNNLLLPPGMVLKPCKYWDKLPTSTGERRIFEPSTVSPNSNKAPPCWLQRLRRTKLSRFWLPLQNFLRALLFEGFRQLTSGLKKFQISR